MPRYTRAAVLEVLGQPLAIREILLPDLLPGQVLVKVFFSGVCRSQLMEVNGGRGSDPWLPHLLGHEGSGQVLEVGKGVTKVLPGDEVILGWVKGEGLDAPGAKYLCAGQTINSGKVTTFSNYTVVSESRVVRKPSGLPLDVAVLFGCALPTGAGMVLNELQPAVGSSVVVLGLGGIGLSALMALCAFECKDVIAIDLSDEKLALAKEFGATHVLNPSRDNVLEKVLKLTSGGADACVESAGTAASIELGFALIRKGGGKLLFASHPAEGEMIRLAPHELISGKRIAGSWGGGSMPDRDIPRMFKIFSDCNVPLDRLLTRRYRLEEINRALDDLEAGTVFRPLIAMDH
ncbi:MAG: zinc-binding dehydrogenase [Candidatus Roizmanbacteria bacterium]|nr:zinc-binding dehydrogenase [Candidatus Roizmanbacteria bacterium]